MRGYLARRFGIFLLVIAIASTINFFLPRVGGRDPIRERLLEEATRGGYLQSGFNEIVEAYNKKFGLDKPLIIQYRNYLYDLARGDFGVSLSNFPKTVGALIVETVPWTLALGGMATLMGFLLGTLLGALLGWPRAPGSLRYLFMPLLTISAIPQYLFGLVLLFFLAFRLKLFPLFGGYSIATFPDWSDFGFLLDVARHAALPALAIVLVTLGFWALGMRGMMVTTQDDDFMQLAEAKGLRASRIFVKYAVRNAILPQTTGLALSLGHIVSGFILVEVVFSYPGIGGLLVQSIIQSDFFVLQGVIFGVI
ncbi:MAG: ABC transporter permease, partial [Chloroflexi bacterium]|nr:ABC transporter permease [Chloroflexota bacterium]